MVDMSPGIVHEDVSMALEPECAPTETYVLEYPPACGNGLVWNKEDGRIAIASGGLVMVLRPGASRDESEAVGLVAWNEGVPCLGSSEECFTQYTNSLYTYSESMEEEVKKSSGKNTSQEVGRGRKYTQVTRVLETLSRINRNSDGSRIRTSLEVSELMDDAYYNSESPKVLGIAWSPSMCSNAGGSMLGVVFDDSSVMLYSVSESISVLWTPLLNLSRYRETTDELRSPCIGISWSEEIVNSLHGFSIIGVVLSNGTVDLYRMMHMSVSLTEGKVEERVKYVGRVAIDDECITQIRFTIVHETQEIVAVCGCRSGRVIVWSRPLSYFGDVKNVENVMKEGSYMCMFEKDDLMVSSLDCSLAYDESAGTRKMLISVGKTVGVIQIFQGSDLYSSKSVLESLQNGNVLPVPKTIDSHTISGLACLMNGRLIVGTSRLGNMLTLHISLDGSVRIGLDPIHHNRGPGKASYKGYGYYGIAASPGGNFLAVAKQAHEPDLPFRRQLQIHQLLTQGYCHIQSVIGPDTEAPSITDALESCIDRWISSASEPRSGRAILWDIERLAVLSKHMDSNAERLTEMLQRVQGKAGLGLNEQNLPCVVSKVSPLCVAVLIHLLKALRNSYKNMLQISDLEMVMMKSAIESILARDAGEEDNQHLSALLALDFVVSHKSSHQWIFTEDFVQKVRSVYSLLGEDVVVDENPPDRQVSRSMKHLVARMRPGPLHESLVASVSSQHDSSEPCLVPRCPATLLGILDGGVWACQSCHRSYSRPTRPEFYTRGTFACTLCAGLVEIDKYFCS